MPGHDIIILNFVREQYHIQPWPRLCYCTLLAN